MLLSRCPVTRVDGVTIPANLYNPDHDYRGASGVLIAGPHVTTYSSDVSLSDHQLVSPTIKYYHSILPCLEGVGDRVAGHPFLRRRALGHMPVETPRMRLTVPGTSTGARHNGARSLLSKYDPSDRGWLHPRLPVGCCSSSLHVHAGSDRE